MQLIIVDNIFFREKEEDSSQQLLGYSKPPQLPHHQPHLRATKPRGPKRTPSLAGSHARTGRRKETKTCESSSPELQVSQCKPLILPRPPSHSPGWETFRFHKDPLPLSHIWETLRFHKDSLSLSHDWEILFSKGITFTFSHLRNTAFSQ